MCVMPSLHTSRKTTFWKNKNVLVTGGAGFLGSHVVDLLVEAGATVTITTSSGKTRNIAHLLNSVNVVTADLTDQKKSMEVVKNQQIIIHLASKVAGIQYNVSHPVEMFNDTVQMAKNILQAAHDNNVERVFLASSACVYPRYCTIPTPEREGFTDDPEPTNLGYGWSKRVVELMGRFYHDEYDMKIAIARPYNLYGPRDTFDPAVSHVIPGLIKRIIDGENPLKVWGSGRQSRSFLYVEDCARGILDLTEIHPNADPVNLGDEHEITIADLTKLIVRLADTKTTIEFDTTKPDGQPRRSCDTKKAKKTIAFKAHTDLEAGLLNTIKWYKQHLSF